MNGWGARGSSWKVGNSEEEDHDDADDDDDELDGKRVLVPRSRRRK